MKAKNPNKKFAIEAPLGLYCCVSNLLPTGSADEVRLGSFGSCVPYGDGPPWVTRSLGGRGKGADAHPSGTRLCAAPGRRGAETEVGIPLPAPFSAGRWGVCPGSTHPKRLEAATSGEMRGGATS